MRKDNENLHKVACNNNFIISNSYKSLETKIGIALTANDTKLIFYILQFYITDLNVISIAFSLAIKFNKMNIAKQIALNYKVLASEDHLINLVAQGEFELVIRLLDNARETTKKYLLPYDKTNYTKLKNFETSTEFCFLGYLIEQIHIDTGYYTEIEDLINNILEYGIGANFKDKDGNTPLHLLALNTILDCNTSPRLVKTFVKQNADINAKDHQGNTPLHLLMQNSKLPSEVIYILAIALITNGANINAKNNNVDTPLALLAENPQLNKELVDNLYRFFDTYKEDLPCQIEQQKPRPSRSSSFSDKILRSRNEANKENIYTRL